MADSLFEDPDESAASPKVRDSVNQIFLAALKQRAERVEIYPSDRRVCLIKGDEDIPITPVTDDHVYSGVIRRLESMADLGESEPWKSLPAESGKFKLTVRKQQYGFNVKRYSTPKGQRIEIEIVYPSR